jgi:hypothetical protein
VFQKDDVGDANNFSYDSGECDEDDDEDGVCEKETSNNIMPQFVRSRESEVMAHQIVDEIVLLPVNVMDVVNSVPWGTCSSKQQCSILVGSKKTTIYAIDPKTGKVKWTQDPHGSGGGRGFTTHPPPNKSSRGPTVLLQREDYVVRESDIDGGEEVFKVELGKFSALDFDVDAHDRGSEEENEMNEREEDHVVGGSRRGTAAAAAAANLSRKDKKTSPILGGTRKHGALHEHKGHHHGGKMFQEDDFDDFDDHPHFRGFPSVALGEVSFVLFLFFSIV